MKQTQARLIGNLLTRKSGATALEIIKAVGTVSPHRRLTDLKDMGWKVASKKVAGKNYLRYFAQPPKATR